MNKENKQDTDNQHLIEFTVGMDGGYVYEKGETIKTVESSRIGCTILRWIDVTLITYLTELIMQKGITHDD